MPKTFAMFTAAAMASLALPGMSGFVSELTVFLGLSNSDAYSYGFKAIAIFLTAVGVILTPIYLLSMLREVFYGKGSQAPLSLAAGKMPNREKSLWQFVCWPRLLPSAFIQNWQRLPMISKPLRSPRRYGPLYRCMQSNSPKMAIAKRKWV